MLKVKSLSICFPAYNEAANIKQSVETALKVAENLADDYEVVVTNDGSKDKTGEIVTEMAKTDPHIILINQENQGYGGAVWTALKQAKKELIFFTDADLQFDLSEIEKLLKYIEEYDVVVGFRAPRVDPFMRKLNAWAWNLLVHRLISIPIKDVDCAFKIFQKKVIDNLEVKSKGATFSAELIWRIVDSGIKIKEVPVKHLPRVAGSPTGAKFGVIKKAFQELRILAKEKRALPSNHQL